MSAPAPLFPDRIDAGRQLATRLLRYRDEQPLLLAFPDGAITVAGPISEALDVPIHLPPRPSHRSNIVRDALARHRAGATARPFLDVSAGPALSATDRVDTEPHAASGPAVRDRTVILVDDGTTGDVLVHAVLQILAASGAARTVLATPVIAESTAEHHSSEVDGIVALHTLGEEDWHTDWYADEAALEEERSRPPAPGGGLRASPVLVALDLAEPEHHALAQARLLSPVEDLHVVHVARPILPNEPLALWGDQEDEASARQALEEAMDRLLADNDLEGAHRHILWAAGPNVAKVIAGLAAELGAEIVVVRSHGRRGFPRWTLGSVAEELVRWSPCPVLIVKG